MTSIRTISTAILAGLGSLLAMPASLALAAPKNAVPAVKETIPWLAYTCAIVAVAGVCFVAFRKPKRSKGQ